MSKNRILIVQVAALGHELVQRFPDLWRDLPFTFQPLKTVFPAVTCTVQATLRTALPPDQHGVLCNGRFDRATRRVSFWEQSGGLLPPPRIWHDFRAAGGTVGVMFWQQSLGDGVDLVLSPAPIHKHGGGMLQDCYVRPAGLYQELVAVLGRRFNLMHYWGPLVSLKSTQWIADATIALLRHGPAAPELLLTYLPHLDYVLQKAGPEHPRHVRRAVSELAGELRRLVAAAQEARYGIIVFGDYAMTPARQVVFPNRELRRAGLFEVRQIGRRSYPDLYASRAFAMVDHQVAHVFVRSPQDLGAVQACLARLPGVERACPAVEVVLAHPAAGELVLVAAADAWFAYPWWQDRHEAPDYATHVDIHSKIGFDPGELFFGWPPPGISQDPGRVRGTHGRTDCPVAFGTTVDLQGVPEDILDLSRRLMRVL